jgi:uncharacterized protein
MCLRLSLIVTAAKPPPPNCSREARQCPVRPCNRESQNFPQAETPQCYFVLLAALCFRFLLTAQLWLRTPRWMRSPHLGNKGLWGNLAATLCCICGKVLLEVTRRRRRGFQVAVHFRVGPRQGEGESTQAPDQLRACCRAVPDPLAVSVFDQEHSEAEERWVTVGRDSYGRVLVFVHTFSEISAEERKVRIISARKATKREMREYEELSHEEGI